MLGVICGLYAMCCCIANPTTINDHENKASQAVTLYAHPEKHTYGLICALSEAAWVKPHHGLHGAEGAADTNGGTASLQLVWPLNSKLDNAATACLVYTVSICHCLQYRLTEKES